ncbi:MAG: hypothetical protein J6W42_02500 [Bacteroidaceae bacterium]|nr:hypothetical protein [Bacteroidaceae bacterium]
MRKILILLIFLLSALFVDAAGSQSVYGNVDNAVAVESVISNTEHNAVQHLLNQEQFGLPGCNIILTEEHSTTAVRIIAKKELKKSQRQQSAVHSNKVNCNHKNTLLTHQVFFTSLTEHRLYLYGFCQMRC